MDTQHSNYVKHYSAALAGEIDDTPDASDYCDCEDGSPLTEECVNYCMELQEERISWEPVVPVTTYAQDHGGAAYSYADDLINGRLFLRWQKEVRDGALRAFDQTMAGFGVDMIEIQYRDLLDFLRSEQGGGLNV